MEGWIIWILIVVGFAIFRAISENKDKEELQDFTEERDPANPEGLSPKKWDRQQDAYYGSSQEVSPEEANQELADVLHKLADEQRLADIIPDLLGKFKDENGEPLITAKDANDFLNQY